MYFKKLEIIGFKSFMEKTTLHFEPGITAVVGPNGCGKSNVFDSIRWVLGEQSIKSLRGSLMQDVIFNGTDSKEPLGMAEVSLTFDNDKRHFTVDENEVVITRRVFRSGESEYLLNKAQVRLKDILDLLMGTGIGAENYSLVEQGKIDLILSSKAEDRRLIFDEAAGITKYKVQKKEALKKLEETEQNLLRVNDIVSEVKRQIASLERQAIRARRYKEIFEELKQKELSLAFLDKEELIKEKNIIINQLKGIEIEEARLLNIIQEHESKASINQAELKKLEAYIMETKNQALGLANIISASEGRVNFQQEKISELDANQKYLQAQIEQTKNRVILDEEKLNNLKAEHLGINKDIEGKKTLLKEKEIRLNELNSSLRASLDNIAEAKRNILNAATKLTQVRNEITDLTSRQQIYLARKKRLDIERLKVNEERAQTKANLENINIELGALEKDFQCLTLKKDNAKKDEEQERLSLGNINAELNELEKEKMTLESHREFLDKLKTKYEDISESMNAVIYLDKEPKEKVMGLVVKIKDSKQPILGGMQNLEAAGFKLSGEAKPIDLDAQKINEQLRKIEEKINLLGNNKTDTLARIEELDRSMHILQEEFRNQEMVLVNKRANQATILEQFNKINEEGQIIAIELSDVDKEISALEEELTGFKSRLSILNEEHNACEGLIADEQNNINLNNASKEEALIIITQVKTGLDGLSKRLESDEATFKILEGAYEQDKDSLANLDNQLKDNDTKRTNAILEIKGQENKIKQARIDIEEKNKSLQEAEDKYQGFSEGRAQGIKEAESDRKALDTLKDKLYDLQIQDKDADFKISSIRDRISQAYRIDLDNHLQAPCGADKNTLSQEIHKLKEKLDGLGTVNLVAIEEYDELKKRYDFLTQQQNDLASAKESVHEAILKINRTTKKMFLETFEKIRQEFRSYFKTLFNGGDAQIFLIDESDPLESGIEIICRPPGKKLQNVLLLSGGEKSLSAIGLIFAIFKVKPSPFCVLDEIDAALDEANVDRFSRLLQDFTRDSQFIVITHNKKTIANANVMYGITMQESGISKIVSVKFGEKSTLRLKENEPQAVAARVA